MRTLMKRFVPLMLVVVLLGALVGCSDQTADAQAAIDAANVEIEKYNDRDAEIAEIMQKTESVDPTPANAKDVVADIDTVLAKLAEQKTSAEKARAEFEKIGDMDVSEEIKTYASMQLKAVDKQLEGEALVTALAEDLRDLFDGLATGKMTEADMNKLGESIEEKSAKLGDVETELEKLSSAADKYFEEKDLGGK